jgi:hypothetical protein
MSPIVAVVEVFGQFAVGLCERLLHDIGRIEPRGEPGVDPQRDHRAEPGGVAHHQRIDGRRVSLGSPVEQSFGIHRELRVSAVQY